MENEIRTTLYVSAAVYTLSEIYNTSLWRTDLIALQDMGHLYHRLSNINPNDWYLSDEEIALVRKVGRLLNESGVIG